MDYEEVEEGEFYIFYKVYLRAYIFVDLSSVETDDSDSPLTESNESEDEALSDLEGKTKGKRNIIEKNQSSYFFLVLRSPPKHENLEQTEGVGEVVLASEFTRACDKHRKWKKRCPAECPYRGQTGEKKSPLEISLLTFHRHCRKNTKISKKKEATQTRGKKNTEENSLTFHRDLQEEDVLESIISSNPELQTCPPVISSPT